MNRIFLSLLAAVAAVSAMAVSVPGSAGAAVAAPPAARARIPNVHAAFRGGDMVTFCRYVFENLTFPKDRYTEGARFRMSVLFQVAKKGNVKEAEVLNSSGDDSLDAEVLRVVGESTGWTPRKGGSPEGREMLQLDMTLTRGADGKLHAEDYWAYRKADTMPKFEGGGLGKFRLWIVEQVGDLDPDGAPIDERATLRFVIEKDGSISGVSVDDKTPVWLIERLEKALNAMPRWTPGVTQGEKVRIQASLPLRFGKAAESAKTDSLGEADAPYLIVDRMPKFQNGGLDEFRKWVAAHVKYPKDMYEKGAEGRVVVSFVINRDGTLSDVNVLQSSANEFSREVVNLLGDSPKWEPGRQNGKVVRVKYTLPVDFRIPSGGRRSAAPAERGRSQIRQF